MNVTMLRSVKRMLLINRFRNGLFDAGFCVSYKILV